MDAKRPSNGPDIAFPPGARARRKETCTVYREHPPRAQGGNGRATHTGIKATMNDVGKERRNNDAGRSDKTPPCARTPESAGRKAYSVMRAACCTYAAIARVQCQKGSARRACGDACFERKEHPMELLTCLAACCTIVSFVIDCVSKFRRRTKRENKMEPRKERSRAGTRLSKH